MAQRDIDAANFTAQLAALSASVNPLCLQSSTPASRASLQAADSTPCSSETLGCLPQYLIATCCQALLSLGAKGGEHGTEQRMMTCCVLRCSGLNDDFVNHDVEIQLKVLRSLASIAQNSITTQQMQRVVTAAIVTTLQIDASRLQWLPTMTGSFLGCCRKFAVLELKLSVLSSGRR